MTFNLDSSMLVSKNIVQAVSYLTYPLNRIHDKSTVFSAQLILQSTINAAYQLSLKQELILSLSTSSLPALPILAACVAANIMWAHWIIALGNRDVDLIIQPRGVYIRPHGSNKPVMTVWEEPKACVPVELLCNPKSAHVPISKLVRSAAVHQPPSLSRGNALAHPAHPRTLAQRLLEEDDNEETEELFAMIKDAPNIISPTPTREKFSFSAMRMPTLISPPSSPEPASSESSRPSSRASTFSTYSFSSSEETLVSQSSFSAAEDESSAVHVNRNLKDVTKYLYQGGVSTVLTGGVMLGGGASASKLKPKNEIPTTKPLFYRAPIGTNKPLGTGRIGSRTDSWRRPARS